MIKKLGSLLIIAALLLACNNDDDCLHDTQYIETVNLTYDSQDNLVRINGGEWLQSMDWNTYVDENNWEAYNDYYGVRHNWDGTSLRIVSPQYELVGAVVEDIYTAWYIEDNALYIDVPTMQEYMDGTDVFYFKVQIKSEIN